MTSKINTINILPTTGCNAKCRHCGIDDSVKGMTMPDSTLEALLDEINGTDIKNINITGGEPLQNGTYKRLASILKNARLKDKNITIFSNGMWAESKEKARYVTKSLKEAGVSHVSLSTDTCHAEFIPAEYIAYAAESCNEAFGVAEIKVTSFKSTYKNDMALIHRIAELLGNKEVRQWTLNSPVAVGKDRITFEDALRFGANVIYSFGDAGMMFGMPHGINVWHHVGLNEGSASDNFPENDCYWSTDKRKTSIFDLWVRNAGCDNLKPTIMPDGSILGCCAFEMENNYRKLKIGEYPATSIKEAINMLEDSCFSWISEGKWTAIYRFLKGKEPKKLKETSMPTSKYIPPCELCSVFQSAASEALRNGMSIDMSEYDRPSDRWKIPMIESAKAMLPITGDRFMYEMADSEVLPKRRLNAAYAACTVTLCRYAALGALIRGMLEKSGVIP